MKYAFIILLLAGCGSGCGGNALLGTWSTTDSIYGTTGATAVFDDSCKLTMTATGNPSAQLVFQYTPPYQNMMRLTVISSSGFTVQKNDETIPVTVSAVSLNFENATFLKQN